MGEENNKLYESEKKKLILETLISVSLLFIGLSVMFLFVGYLRYIIANFEFGKTSFSRFWVYAGIVLSCIAIISARIASHIHKSGIGYLAMWIFFVNLCSFIILGCNVITLISLAW